MPFFVWRCLNADRGVFRTGPETRAINGLCYRKRYGLRLEIFILFVLLCLGVQRAGLFIETQPKGEYGVVRIKCSGIEDRGGYERVKRDGDWTWDLTLAWVLGIRIIAPLGRNASRSRLVFALSLCKYVLSVLLRT